jgi:hypothetical protein
MSCDQPSLRDGVAQRREQAGRVPGGTAGELLALEQPMTPPPIMTTRAWAGNGRSFMVATPAVRLRRLESDVALRQRPCPARLQNGKNATAAAGMRKTCGHCADKLERSVARQ